VTVEPRLERLSLNGLHIHIDASLRNEGVVVAFTERAGGVSQRPFASLNLAAHVGDDPAAVDLNRSRALHALALGAFRDQLTMADQVHGESITHVASAEVGAGAYAAPGTRAPVPAADALVTGEPGVPLLLCFADCVPVVLVAPGPVVAVVHAGWRGALASLPGKAVLELARTATCSAGMIRAYVGAHIGACNYEIGEEILSQFVIAFGTFARAESGGLDLGRVVSASLTDAGVDPCNIASLGTCTAEATERFFSYRAECGLTGRHGALVCILP